MLATNEASPISGLESTLIPLRAFPLRKWSYSNPLWYYHGPGLDHRIRADSAFLDLVVPLLRDICWQLLAAGLCTTPSCQGHFYDSMHYEEAWAELTREAELIRRDGLVVHDSETHQSHSFRDPGYRLPWPDFVSFCTEVVRQQCRGYLGVAIPTDRLDVAIRLDRWGLGLSATVRVELDVQLSELLGQTMLSIFVDPVTPRDRDEAWAAVAATVRRVLA